MRLITILVGALAVWSAQGLRILHTNDDGWADLSIRLFYDTIVQAGHDAILSAPAIDQSSKGSLDEEPEPRMTRCQFDTCDPCPEHLLYGTNVSDPSGRLNWVNSYPVTAARYGLDQFAPRIWQNQSADLVLVGPNNGPNVASLTEVSGTVGVAQYTARRGIPTIAFSGAAWGVMRYDKPPTYRHSLYNDMAYQFTQALLTGGKPYMPQNTFLNVNFPNWQNNDCNETSKWEWFLTRLDTDREGNMADWEYCGTDQNFLQFDTHCSITITLLEATSKKNAGVEEQRFMRNRLKNMLACPPS
ncbi:hypothetical protein PFICI_11515 [Pestalotiopsis fici W106-1]|uniref:Survival protein SurE-like phosphatase/nucleotidase domain-containing protein n=1 Tax=Pestalotiopsis fici (strain W106-1 / CGMCC3.15140) TaxID=1229662 RepID=W3WQK4_PESFW|nr:uncharacterized protein PFICI_11515 [Pestalotiopsis fici W106-1]ETS76128.1 hypothetical protein PFICI_11515 [Pestalotiopsis fici W106-1]